jgi:hypothetical protein
LESLEHVQRTAIQILGHDNYRRLCRIYGWEERKIKTSWEGNGADYETISVKAVREMSTPEVQHFLVACSLFSDPYCSAYNLRQALTTDSNLAQAANRYKIGSAKLAAEVRTDLSNKKQKTEPEVLRRE